MKAKPPNITPKKKKNSTTESHTTVIVLFGSNIWDSGSKMTQISDVTTNFIILDNCILFDGVIFISAKKAMDIPHKLWYNRLVFRHHFALS